MMISQDQRPTKDRSHARKRLDRGGLPVDKPDSKKIEPYPPPDDGHVSSDDCPAVPAQDITEPDPTRIGGR